MSGQSTTRTTTVPDLEPLTDEQIGRVQAESDLAQPGVAQRAAQPTKMPR